MAVSQCKVCQHAQLAEIDVALRSATSLRDLALQYGLSKDGLARHKARHLTAMPAAKRATVKRDKAKRSTTQSVPSLPSLSVTHANGKRPQGQRIPDDERADYQERFLTEFSAHGIITRACNAIGIAPITVRHWEEFDETFSPRYAQAKEAVNDMYRDEARRRAVEGTESYVVSQGKLVYDPETGKPLIERKYSDTLLQFVMKAKMHEYREKQQVELSGQMSVQHEHAFQDDPEAAAIARALLRRVGNRSGESDPSGSSMAGE